MSTLKRSRGIATVAIMATVIATMAVGFVLLVWMQQTSGDHVFDRTKAFSDLMRIVRPIFLLLVLGLWKPSFDVLHRFSFITKRTHERAHSIWPRLSIWAALIELTLGQGFVLLGLASAGAYGFYLSRQ